jgi:hypothetical protein
MLRGALIYAVGDTIATVILGQFNPLRMLGIMLVGSTVYAFEIPLYFRWIDKCTVGIHGWHYALGRTMLAFLYFNPLWIARHLLFLAVFSGQLGLIDLSLLKTASLSWLVNIPISLIGNAIIQLKIRLSWRFVASAVFSSLLAIYYALSAVWFS